MKRSNRIWKAGIWCLMLALAGGLLGTGGSARAKSKGYVFSYKGATATMDGKANKLMKKAGTPKAKKATKSCAYKGKDYTYKYNDFILYTYSNSDKGKQYVNGITFLTSRVSTKEGIRIGSTLEQVKKKYGKGSEKFGVYTFKKGNCKMQIEITDDEVTNIRYIVAKKPKSK